MTFKCQRNVCATFAVFNDWQINLVLALALAVTPALSLGLGHGLGVSLCLHKVQHLLVVVVAAVVCLLLSLLICTCRRPRIPASWHLSNRCRCRCLHRGTSRRRSKPLNTWQINICSRWGGDAAAARGAGSTEDPSTSCINAWGWASAFVSSCASCCRCCCELPVDVACYFGQVIAICCCHCCCCPNTQHWSVKNIPMSGISNLSLSHASPLPSAHSTPSFTCLQQQQQQSTPLSLYRYSRIYKIQTPQIATKCCWKTFT